MSQNIDLCCPDIQNIYVEEIPKEMLLSVQGSTNHCLHYVYHNVHQDLFSH